MSKYTCEICEESYERERSDEECLKEVAEIMPETIHDEMAIICDDCWIEAMEWYKTLTEAQKKKMREDYIKKEAH